MSRAQREKNATRVRDESKDDRHRCRCVGGTRIETRRGDCKECGGIPRHKGRFRLKED